MNRDMLLAVLSLDAYHRDYNPGLYLSNLQANTTSIGNLTLGAHSGVLDTVNQTWIDNDIGFFAQSYNLLDANGAIAERYISYRGTDSDLSLSP